MQGTAWVVAVCAADVLLSSAPFLLEPVSCELQPSKVPNTAPSWVHKEIRQTETELVKVKHALSEQYATVLTLLSGLF